MMCVTKPIRYFTLIINPTIIKLSSLFFSWRACEKQDLALLLTELNLLYRYKIIFHVSVYVYIAY